jgi:glycosyltransferase involved in cell wall biosynthesis
MVSAQRATVPADSVEVAPGGRRGILLFVINEAYFLLSHRNEVVLAAMHEGYEVHVAAPNHHAWAPKTFALSDLTRRGLVVHEIPLSRRGLNPLVELRTFLALARLYRRLRPALVHHITIKPNLYGGLAARWCGVPATVFAVSGMGEMFSGTGVVTRGLRPLVAWGLKTAFGHPNSAVIVQNSEDERQLLANGMVRPGRTQLIRGSGVDVAAFRETPEPSGRPVVLLAARLIWEKGIAEFVHAARLLRAGGSDARFVLVGGTHPTNPKAVPEATLQQWQRDGVVEWWGYRTEMSEVLASSHIVCLPSKYGEGVPKVLLEAGACGRAVVATDIPGCREAVAHGETGLLVAPGSAEALAEALRSLLADPVRRRRMGARGRQRIEAEFDVREVAARTVAVYSALRVGPQVPH